MNRIPKAVYTKEFREEVVKLAMTDGVGVSEAARRPLGDVDVQVRPEQQVSTGPLDRAASSPEYLPEF